MKQFRPLAPPRRRPHSRRRVGALLSAEMLIVMPIVITILLAIVEFSLVLSAYAQLRTAAQAGARAAAMPGAMLMDVEEAVNETLDPKLAGDPNFVIDVDFGMNTGEPSRVELTLPMSAATPDMLVIYGFSTTGLKLVAESVMRNE